MSLAAFLAAIAWRLRTLSASGALAATGVGAAVLYGCGWWGGALLLTFFVGSTVVSRATTDPAVARGEAKGNTRDWAQVLANGGAPALGALLGRIEIGLGIAALSAGLAAAAADTWATSIGATSPTLPRHLLTCKEVPPGTSGGVTWRGTLGGVVGAAVIGMVTWAATRLPSLAVFVIVIGSLGMLFDSLLGATVQERFHCDACNESSERAVHRCGARPRRVTGIPGMGNDAVNATTTILATLVAYLSLGTFIADTLTR